MGLAQSKIEGWGADEWAPKGLSHVGEAVFEKLRTEHAKHRHTMWNVTRSAMIGPLQQTPAAEAFTDESFSKKLAAKGHSNDFVDAMFDLMSKTTKWCDVMSLAPPVEGGRFLKKMEEALKIIAENAKGKDDPVIVRMMYGFGYGDTDHVEGGMGFVNPLAIDCNKWRDHFKEVLPDDANLRLWVGAWRYGQSWNHAKIIAVDGKYLHTGGHNLWSETYLRKNPVHDISIEMEGHAAQDAHLFANAQWEWIKSRQDTLWGRLWDNVPDWVPVLAWSRVNISEWPVGKATVFAPSYKRSIADEYDPPEGAVPVISVGRQGAIVDRDRPADDAFVAMFDSATKTIRMSLQDLGPPTPLLGWPKNYYDAMARAMWKRGVVIQIVLSNLNGDGYSHGYSLFRIKCAIVKRMKREFPEATDADVRKIIKEKLLISFIRHKVGKYYYQEEGDDGKIEISNHSKFIIVDDVCSYTGSQNLYVCDLPEWGVIVDDANITATMMEDFWNPMWEVTYDEHDCGIEEVMDELKNDTDEDEEVVNPCSLGGKKQVEEIVMALVKAEVPRST